MKVQCERAQGRLLTWPFWQINKLILNHMAFQWPYMQIGWVWVAVSLMFLIILWYHGKKNLYNKSLVPLPYNGIYVPL